MDKKPEKILFTYRKDENGNAQIDEVFTSYEDGEFTRERFMPEWHMKDVNDLLDEKGLSGNLQEAVREGIFASVDADKEDSEDFIFNFFPEHLGNDRGAEDQSVPPLDNNFFDDDDEYEGRKEKRRRKRKEKDPITPVTGGSGNNNFFDDDDEYETEKADHHIARNIAAGTLAASAVAGGLLLFHSCSQEQIDEAKENQESDDLLANMTEEQKEFLGSVFDAVEAFNTRTTEDGTFKLDADKSTLHMTIDEALALKVILNDYSSEELYNVFGTVSWDTTDLMNWARSAYSKYSTYCMNATKASGLSTLINDGAAREFFENHEDDVIAFNNNPVTERSDEVIKGLYYDYVYGGSTGEYAKINNDGVAWFSTASGFGFELANRNIEEFLRINNVSEEEIAKYQEAAAEVGMSLNQITTSELLNGINEEIDLDIIDEINNKSLCAAVTAQTRDKVSALNTEQQIKRSTTAALAASSLKIGLKEIGATSQANKIPNGTTSNLSGELLDEIRDLSKDGSALVEEYQRSVNSSEAEEAKLLAVLDIARAQYEIKEEIDLPDLINNRFRTKEKKDELVAGVDEDGITVVDGEKFNELSKEEQDAYIRENGTVVNETTITTEQPVSKEDLTPQEQQQVASQEAILKEIESTKNNLITRGVNDAVTYTDQAGAYKYSGTIVIPYNNEAVDTNNMSLFNIVAYASAFGDGGNINSNDPQVQARMNKDAEKVTGEINSLSSEAKQYLQNQYGSNWREQFINESYKSGFTEQVDGSLREARAMGATLRETAEREYKKAQEEADRLNQTEQPVTTPATNPTPAPTPDDPNLNPDHGQEDEKPFNPSENKNFQSMITEPFVYLSDAEWEAAYGNSMTEESPAKAK